jgi:hypothetical protein
MITAIDLNADESATAAWVARFLKARWKRRAIASPTSMPAGWDVLRYRHRERTAASGAANKTLGADGKIHPRAIFDAIAEVAAPITSRSRTAAIS